MYKARLERQSIVFNCRLLCSLLIQGSQDPLSGKRATFSSHHGLDQSRQLGSLVSYSQEFGWERMHRTDNCSTELHSCAPTAFRFLRQGLKHKIAAKDEFVEAILLSTF